MLNNKYTIKSPNVLVTSPKYKKVQNGIWFISTKTSWEKNGDIEQTVAADKNIDLCEIARNNFGTSRFSFDQGEISFTLRIKDNACFMETSNNIKIAEPVNNLVFTPQKTLSINNEIMNVDLLRFIEDRGHIGSGNGFIQQDDEVNRDNTYTTEKDSKENENAFGCYNVYKHCMDEARDTVNNKKEENEKKCSLEFFECANINPDSVKGALPVNFFNKIIGNEKITCNSKTTSNTSSKATNLMKGIQVKTKKKSNRNAVINSTSKNHVKKSNIENSILQKENLGKTK